MKSKPTEVSTLKTELKALRAIAEAAKPFLSLEQSRGHLADAFHISMDGGRTGIGQHLKKAFQRWEKVRKP